MKTLLPAVSLLLAFSASTYAAPLTEARVARIINDVSVVTPSQGSHPASLDQVVKDDMAVKTGIKSRSELRFQDDTLTRLGPESFFSFKTGTREMSLEHGTMLLQVPKGHGGAKIRTAAVTAAITGTTIMLEHLPGKTVKVLVLEGSLRLSINGRFGDSLLLLPGRMVIMPPDAKRIPDPVPVDLAKVMKTSSLVNMGDKPLPSTGLIQTEIETQARNKSNQELIDSNLVILGRGNRVRAAGDDLLAALDRKHGLSDVFRAVAGPTPPPAQPDATPLPNASPAATPVPSATPMGSATPSPTPAEDDDDDDNDDEGDDDDDDDDGRGFDRVLNIGTSDSERDFVTINQPIDLSSGGKTGKVVIHAKESVQINAPIKVSESAAPKPSNRGGRIEVNSQVRTGNAITVSSSGDLLSLMSAAAPGPTGSIKFTTAGGAVNVNGGTLRADRGEIDIRTEGDAGTINLASATLNASTVKLRTHGDNGQLNIGGGSINADTLISLYAGGSNGQVNFNENVTLSGTSVKNISGNTVTVRDGRIVTVQGPAAANVFTNNPNYTGSGGNGSTTGTFSGAGANTQPLRSSPGPGR
ncbi:MAG TPA: FecR domain-containing protein [Chthoniobacterales bacterium]|nr:FecR domain-containing protein [Chthoniobacterales bacterium]